MSITLRAPADRQQGLTVRGVVELRAQALAGPAEHPIEVFLAEAVLPADALRPPVIEHPDAAMQIDAATRANLELTRSLSGKRQGSLLAAIDRTVTAGGARLLERRLSSPSRVLEVVRGLAAADPDEHVRASSERLLKYAGPGGDR